MKTLSLKTQDVIEGISIFQDCDIIETLYISNSTYNYVSNFYKATSDIPFYVTHIDSDNIIATTTDFTSPELQNNSYFRIRGTQLNQIIYVSRWKNRDDNVTVNSSRVLKIAPTSSLTCVSCIIEDIPHSLKTLKTYATTDIKLDLSNILGGSNSSFVFQSANLKLLDISKLADTFNTFQINNTYVGNINIVDYFANKTCNIIRLSDSDFIGDICDLVERYFNSNKFLTFVFETTNTEVTLYNKSLVGTNSFQIIITESGVTIKKGNSTSGQFEETILTYNGSTWEGSWLQ